MDDPSPPAPRRDMSGIYEMERKDSHARTRFQLCSRSSFIVRGLNFQLCHRRAADWSSTLLFAGTWRLLLNQAIVRYHQLNKSWSITAR